MKHHTDLLARRADRESDEKPKAARPAGAAGGDASDDADAWKDLFVEELNVSHFEGLRPRKPR